MANLYWTGPKVKREELVHHMMDTANKRLPDFTHYGIRFDEGMCELWIEIEDVDDEEVRLWPYFDNATKILGWQIILMRCPPGYIDAGFKNFVEVGDAGTIEVIPIPRETKKKVKKVAKKST